MNHDYPRDIEEEIQKIRNVFSDDMNVLKDIVHEFTVNHYILNIVNILESAIECEDHKVIFQQGHKLKGCFSYFHDQKIIDSASKLEKMGQEKADWNHIRDALNQFKNEYQRLEAILVETISTLDDR